MAEVRTTDGAQDISIVALVGRLDIDGVHTVELPLTTATVARRRSAAIDMTAVEFIGSLGIGLLVRCAVSLQRSGARLVLYGCQPLVRRSIEISKVNSVVPVADDLAAALVLISG